METPQELIYRAWENTPKPILYATKDAKGNLVEKEIDFAVPEKNEFYLHDYTGVCNMCGKPAYGGIPIKKMFSSNYMDWAIHKDPESTHICKACAFCAGMNPIGRVVLFRYPLVAGKELHLCNRQQFRNYLLNPPEPPFVMIFPTSQKKHLFAKSKISYSREQYFCNLEEITISITPKIREIMADIEALRGIGFTKTDIEAGNIPGNVVKRFRFSLYDFEKLIEIMNQLNDSEMFKLALEVSQKMEEEEAICYLGLTPKTR